MNLRISASGLVKSHLSGRRPHPALMGADLDLHSGSLHVLTGVNGAGKTTLLKILAGLDIPDAGTVQVQHPSGTGLILTNPTTLRSLSAWLPDKPGFSSSLTARQSMSEVLILDGVTKLEREARIEVVKNDFDLEELLDRPGTSCSRGQQAQLAMARLALLERFYWWLDEPFAALDSAAIERVCLWMDAKVRLGHVVVLCTHHADGGPALARSWSVPIKRWVLHSGRMEQVSEQEEKRKGESE